MIYENAEKKSLGGFFFLCKKMKRGLQNKPLNWQSVYSFLPNKMNKIKSMKLGLPNNLSHAGQTVLF